MSDCISVESSTNSLLTVEGNRCYSYVYLVRCGANPYYKIGHASVPPLARLASLQTGCPVRLTMLHVFALGNANDVERKLHQRFSHRRMLGEWFRLSPEEVAIIISVLSRLMNADRPIIRKVA